jgi:hypothetical protein
VQTAPPYEIVEPFERCCESEGKAEALNAVLWRLSAKDMPAKGHVEEYLHICIAAIARSRSSPEAFLEHEQDRVRRLYA